MKNKVLLYVEYGNPGDGCIWRWSIALWDDNGDYKDVNHWGSGNLETEEQALKYMADYNINIKGPKLQAMVLVGTTFCHDKSLQHNTECIFFDVTSEITCNKVKRFFDEPMQHAILEALSQDIDITSEFYMKCSCGEYCHDAEYMYPTGYHGDGGIGVIYTDYVCEECYHSGCCHGCGEFYGEAQLYRQAECYPACEYCIVEALEHDIRSDTSYLENDMEAYYKKGTKVYRGYDGRSHDLHARILETKKTIELTHKTKDEIEECLESGDKDYGRDVPGYRWSDNKTIKPDDGHELII